MTKKQSTPKRNARRNKPFSIKRFLKNFSDKISRAIRKKCSTVRTKPRKSSKDRAGFTLTELAVVMSIMGIILGAIWMAAANVSNANRLQRANAQIMTIESGYQSLYAQRGIDTPECFGIAGEITCMGQNAGFFPPDMIPKGAYCNQGDFSTWPHSPWNGLVWVDSCQNENTVVISYFGLSPSACVSLAASVLNNSTVVFEGIGDGTNNQRQWLAPIANNQPWSLATITSYCDGSGAVNEVQVGFLAR